MISQACLIMILKGAIAGAVSAAVVDINAWAKSSTPFDWKLAIKRWVAGAMTGATAAAGMTAL